MEETQNADQTTESNISTLIIGHKKPDLDAVVAPMALAYLYEHADCFGYEDIDVRIADPINNETEYVFNRFNATPPKQLDTSQLDEKTQVILADHNEESQRAEGIATEHITEIVDHHKLNVNLNKPLFVTTKPWGSTSTIVAWLMEQNEVTPDKTLAGLMLSAILSDTVGFKSSTTTEQDKEQADKLAKVAGVEDLNDLIFGVLKAKSDLSDLNIREKATNDYKEFDFGGKSVFINQIETVEQDEILADEGAFVETLKELKQENDYEYAFIAVSDILNVNTKLLYPEHDEREIAVQAFSEAMGIDDHILDIGPKLSRKKEIAPAIEGVLGEK